jgi:hypothetical protein
MPAARSGENTSIADRTDELLMLVLSIFARMTLLAELEGFVGDHGPHGMLSCDATEPAWNGYLLTVACPCGVVFERWVTPEDAELDLLRSASLN